MARRSYRTSLSWRTGAVRRELAAAAGMLALVFNLLATIVLSANPVLVRGSDDGAPVRWAVCSPMTTSASGELPSGEGGHPQCVFCTPLFSGAIDAPCPAVFSLIRPFQQASCLQRGHAVITAAYLVAPRPRGPPAV
jgi:hypothetical protein